MVIVIAWMSFIRAIRLLVRLRGEVEMLPYKSNVTKPTRLNIIRGASTDKTDANGSIERRLRRVAQHSEESTSHARTCATDGSKECTHPYDSRLSITSDEEREDEKAKEITTPNGFASPFFFLDECFQLYKWNSTAWILRRLICSWLISFHWMINDIVTPFTGRAHSFVRITRDMLSFLLG